MDETFWQKHDIEAKVIAILREPEGYEEGHHFGLPFLTAYQIAIELNRRHPEIAAEKGWPVGGAGAGDHNSLAQYLARWLSQFVKDRPNGPIEGAFLANAHLNDISFDNSGEIIHSSLMGSPLGLSMFRLRSGGGG